MVCYVLINMQLLLEFHQDGEKRILHCHNVINDHLISEAKPNVNYAYYR